MDELFKEISDSRRIRSHGNTTYLKDGRLFANEKILRGYEDFEKLKTMGSMAIEGLKNTPDFLFGVVKGIQKGTGKGTGKAKKAAKDMSPEDVDDFASTKHKGLPRRVKKETKVRTLIRKIVREIMSEIRRKYN